MFKTIAVYHQCFDNKKATEFAIKNYKIYNNSLYFLISDGGLSFEDIFYFIKNVYFFSC